MFDNPKKELQRLQEQLLAAEEERYEAFEDLSEGEYDELENDDVYDAELESLLNGTDLRTRPRCDDGEISGRAAGFDAEAYEMDAGRYVPAPRKKRMGFLVAFGLIQAVAVIVLIAWLLRRML